MVDMEENAPHSDWQSLTSVYRSATLCSLGFFFVSFIIPIVAYDPAGLGASGFQVALVFALLTLGSALFSPVAGRITRYGRRRESIFLGSVIRAVAYLGMAASFYARSIDFLILDSLIWGLGVAFYTVGSDAEISERMMRENRSEAFGKRSAVTAQGQIVGTIIGFVVFLVTDIYLVLEFYAFMNVVGGLLVYLDKRAAIERSNAITIPAVSASGRNVAALVFAAAVDAFVLALLAPFVELFILEAFTTQIEMVALLYLPGGVLTAFVGGTIGRAADRSNKTAVVAGSALVVSSTTFFIAVLPSMVGGVPLGMFLIAPLFALQSVAGLAVFTVMTSVLGTVYEGKAGEGFGRFEAAMGAARFSGPLMGGIFWDRIGPVAPFFFVGFAELLLIPAYYMGMRQYQRALQAK
jgi:MFS family permease